jgi:hypothetical protein
MPRVAARLIEMIVFRIAIDLTNLSPPSSCISRVAEFHKDPCARDRERDTRVDYRLGINVGGRKRTLDYRRISAFSPRKIGRCSRLPEHETPKRIDDA